MGEIEQPWVSYIDSKKSQPCKKRWYKLLTSDKKTENSRLAT